MNYANPEFDITNPADRAAVVLVLDTSGSMSGKPIAALNDGYRTFLETIRKDDAAAMTIDLMTIDLKTEPTVAHAFGPIESYPESPAPFTASSGTGTAPALRLALDSLDERIALYRHNGVGVLKPWIVLLTDGRPDNMSKTMDVVADIVMRRESEKLNYLCVGTGDDVDWSRLDQISGGDPVVLDSLKFTELFRWLSRSLHQVSTAGVEDQQNVCFESMASWARMRG